MTPLTFASPAIAALLATLVTAAACFDLRWRRIPNWLTLGGMAAGVALNTAAQGLGGLTLSIEGVALGFGAYFMLYRLHGIGAGDVKLMGAVGALLGPPGWFQVFLATALAGGLMAAAACVAKGRLRQTLWNVGFIVIELIHLRAPYLRRAELDVRSGQALKMPHGFAIAAGVLTCIGYACLQ
jgi:prepilin peptidase CpaA